MELEPGAITGSWIPGTLATHGLLYAPLMVGERLLGVMTIRSPKAKVYGERERSIFHTLCAYGAIPLDNASAYATAAAQQRADHANAELLQTQAQLVRDIAERERTTPDHHSRTTPRGTSSGHGALYAWRRVCRD